MNKSNYRLKIVNYKLSFKVNKKMKPQIICLDGKSKLTVYKHANQHVNVTGVKSLKKLKSICKFITSNNDIQIISENVHE